MHLFSEYVLLHYHRVPVHRSKLGGKGFSHLSSFKDQVNQTFVESFPPSCQMLVEGFYSDVQWSIVHDLHAATDSSGDEFIPSNDRCLICAE